MTDSELVDAILAMTERKRTFSVGALAERVHSDVASLTGVLNGLTEAGAVTPFGIGIRFEAHREVLLELQRRMSPAAPTDTVEEAKEASDAAPAEQPASAASSAPEAPASSESPEAPMPEEAPKAPKTQTRLTRLERVLAKVNSVPVTKLTDAERALAVDQAFAKMADTVVEANKAITALAEKTDLVDATIDLFDIVRVMPEGRGVGGARVTYSAGTGRRGAKVLVDIPWDNPTRKGLAKAVKRVEDRVFSTIERMADYVIRNSKA